MLLWIPFNWDDCHLKTDFELTLKNWKIWQIWAHSFKMATRAGLACSAVGESPILPITTVETKWFIRCLYLLGYSWFPFLFSEWRQIAMPIYHTQTQKNCSKPDWDEGVELKRNKETLADSFLHATMDTILLLKIHTFFKLILERKGSGKRSWNIIDQLSSASHMLPSGDWVCYPDMCPDSELNGDILGHR